MDSLDPNTIVGVAIGYLIAEGIARLRRRLARTRFWKGIARTAGDTLKDPTIPVDDPHTAAEQALLSAQREKVDEVARAIAPSKSETAGE
jgi:hypothetical protein